MADRQRGPADGRSRRVAWLLAPAVVLLVWQLLVATHRWSPALLPPPRDVAEAFGRMWSDGELITNAGASLRRVLAGLAIGTTAGVLVGLCASGSRLASRVLRQIVDLFRPIPPIAWIPLAIAGFGVGFAGSVAVVIVGVFFPFTIACADAIIRARATIADVASMYDLPRAHLLRIGFPAALPEVASAFRLAVGFGWTSVVAAELVSARSGLGYVIQESRLLLQMDRVLVAMIAIGLIGFALSGAAALGERALLRGLRPDLDPPHGAAS